VDVVSRGSIPAPVIAVLSGLGQLKEKINPQAYNREVGSE